MKPKYLIPLALATAGLIAAAIHAVNLRQAETLSAHAPEPLLPGLEDEVNAINEIVIRHKDGEFSIVRTEAGDWVVPEKGGYPADFEKLKRTVLALARMKTVEPKTRDPHLFAELGLADVGQEGSNAILVTMTSGGAVLESVLVGDRKYGAGPGGARTYMRVPGGERAWLVEGAPDISKKSKDWLIGATVSLPRERVREVVLSGPGRENLIIRRADADQANFTVANLPQGAKLDYDSAPNAIGGALGFIDFDDVKPVEEIDMEGASKAVFRTFDGLEVTVSIVTVQDVPWAAFTAAALEGASEASASEAATIEKRTSGWAYKLPNFKARDLTKRMSDLLAKPEDKANGGA